MKLNVPLSISACFLGLNLFADEPAKSPDLSSEKTLYEIGYSHLDTQWRWTYPQVISEFIPNTVHENEPLFEHYPNYVFNWTGANRYQFMKEYHPQDYEKVRKWVAEGRWFPAGSSWEENDVNVPSSESLIRQILLGHNFFKQEFGTESSEYMIPDCFGFPASLPSVLAHCGLRGFSTQKLTWGSAVGIPFNVGVWEGPDGQSVIAALNAGSYNSEIRQNLATNANWNERLTKDGRTSGVYADYVYFGTGDRGGAPDARSVRWLETSLHTKGPVHVVSGRADQMFRDITDAQKAKLPVYKGDLLLTEHSAGSITSEAYMKRWNRKNELLADAAERASVAAAVLGATPYPHAKLQRAWELVLGGQFHDLLPGTSIPKAYEFTWNDEIIAMNCFAEALQNGVGGVARALDTRAEGVPLVVYNPLSIAREDVAEAELEFRPGTEGVQVFDGESNPVPTQLLALDHGKLKFCFLAKVPSIGFAVYSVKSSTLAATQSGALKVTERSLEGNRYRITLNDAGDIASVFDKVAGKELLSAPARLAFQTENPRQWPAWNMDWTDQSKDPRGYVDGPATFRVVENGPVRVAIEVTRQAENSVFIQTIHLAAGEAGDRIEIKNHIDWLGKASALKATFPLTVSNPSATYNWEVGKIQRGNNDPKKYEVPSHQWFDLTDTGGAYGVSILNDTKYGSDKPSDNLLRLTLLYTPGIAHAGDYHEQQFQDWGRHDFVYGIYGHAGDWRSGKSDWQSARLGQPLLVFRTEPHAGKLGRSFSLLHLNSDDVAVRAVKMAEDHNQVVVRLQELNGAGAKTVELAGVDGVGHVVELNGIEQPLGPVESRGQTLALDFKPFQLRTLGLRLGAPTKLTPPVSAPVKLPYNLDIFSFSDSKYDGGCDDDGNTIPAEMISDNVVSEGVRFRIGPTTNGKENAVQCQGQTISLPHGNFNRIYLLAMAVHGDTEATFKVDGHETPLRIEDWSGYIGQWDNRVFQGDVPILTYSVTNPLDHLNAGFIKRDPLAWFCSHRHQQDGGDQVYTYSYLFKYHFDIPGGAKTLTLPDNPRIRIVAVSMVQDDNDATVATLPLYDDFTGRTALPLKSSSNSTATAGH